jgi:hypothetical protein
LEFAMHKVLEQMGGRPSQQARAGGHISMNTNSRRKPHDVTHHGARRF